MRGKRENSLRKGMLSGPVNGLDQLRMMFCAARHPSKDSSSGSSQSDCGNPTAAVVKVPTAYISKYQHSCNKST
jgi:hypothetical protein